VRWAIRRHCIDEHLLNAIEAPRLVHGDHHEMKYHGDEHDRPDNETAALNPESSRPILIERTASQAN